MSVASPHLLEHVAATGPLDGPSYRYHGAEIHCLPGGHVCGLVMPDHPLNGATFGVPSLKRTAVTTGFSLEVVGTITPLVDLRLDERRLPQNIRQQPRP